MAEIERTMLDKDVATVVISGEFDTADEVRAELAVDVVLEMPIKALLVDLTDCTFMDLGGLRSLLRSNERAAHAGIEVAVAGVHPRVESLFELTGVRDGLAIHEDRDEALASLRAAAA